MKKHHANLGILSEPAADDPKIAVVVIHGMGEQRPMETLRSFVKTVWQHNYNLFQGLKSGDSYHPWDIWSKPDRISGSTELRRLTTSRTRKRSSLDAQGQRADFFELHWADITADNKWSDFREWFWKLLWRLPCNVPEQIRVVWGILWLLIVAFLICGFLLVSSQYRESLLWAGTWLDWLDNDTSRFWLSIFVFILVTFGLFIKQFLTKYFGDVARYTSATPRNIPVRREARERGLKLLDGLAASGEYNRIIVVGHSLGSILAHDLVYFAWSEAAREIRVPENSDLYHVIKDCEKASENLLDAAGYEPEEVDKIKDGKHKRKIDQERFSEALEIFRIKQRRLFKELASTPIRIAGQKYKSAWLISDLITLGSPLTHAKYLLVDSFHELQMAINRREMLRCPPVLEEHRNKQFCFFFENPKDSGYWRMHHAAAMAPVRWTNGHLE